MMKCGRDMLVFFKPFIVMLVLGCFLLLQPDLGSTVVLFIIMSGMLFYRRGENFYSL